MSAKLPLLEPTDDVAAEEGVDPAHDQGVRDHHSHVPLHHAHHPLHRIRIRQRIRRRLALLLRLLQERARLVPIRQGLAACFKSLLRKGMVVGAEEHTLAEKSLFPQTPLIEFLRRRIHQDGGIMAEDPGQDHDDGDGDEDPVAVMASVSLFPRHWAWQHTITGGPYAGSVQQEAPSC